MLHTDGFWLSPAHLPFVSVVVGGDLPLSRPEFVGGHMSPVILRDVKEISKNKFIAVNIYYFSWGILTMRGPLHTFLFTLLTDVDSSCILTWCSNVSECVCVCVPCWITRINNIKRRTFLFINRALYLSPG